MLKIKTGFQPLEEVLNNFTQENLDSDLTFIINKWKKLLDSIPFKFTVYSEVWDFNESIFATLRQTWENERFNYSLGNMQDIKLEGPYNLEKTEDGLLVTIPSAIEMLTNWYNELITSLSVINSVLDNPNNEIFNQFNLKPENIIIRETKLFSLPSKPNDIVFLFGYFDPETRREVFVEVPVYSLPQRQECSHVFGILPNEVTRFKVPHIKEIFKEVNNILNNTNNVVRGRINFDPSTDNIETNTIELASGSYWYWFMLYQG